MSLPTTRAAHWAARLFNLIAEPRAIRLIQFVIYAILLVVGINTLFHLPANFVELLGHFTSAIFPTFIVIGSALGAVAVLPGIWWLERAGIIALISGIIMYLIIASTLGISFIGGAFLFVFALTFVQRWMEIRRFQLAPKRG